MRSILLSTNPSFSFFYTKRKLVDTNTFFWIKVHRKFQYSKKILFVFFSFVMESLLWWSFVLLKRQKLLQPLGCLSRPLSLLLTVPPNCANFDQTKKKKWFNKRGKVGCATISHFDSPWKSVKRSKEFLKLAYLDFYWRLKKRAAGNHEKGKTWKLRNVELSWIQLCIET